MLNSGSRITYRFAISGTQMVMVDSVEEGQLNCCVLLWDLILLNIETTQIIEAVVAECHGCYLAIPTDTPEWLRTLCPALLHLVSR